ncbi:MAG: hypothetical protein K2O14_00745 [Oscillospiraceae bacterium]|nr:hypothetical protein [Oscillospiraceae bacterium]
MSVLKRNSVCYGGGVDISNTLDLHRTQELPTEQVQEETAQAPEQVQENLAELLDIRERELSEREAAIAAQEKELSALKELYIEQGKTVILDAKQRAESITKTAQENASKIVSEAEQNRESVYIKAKAEGYEQGRIEGVDACLAAGQDILNEARAFSEAINAEKEELFSRYEKEIFETVMAIANKVTLDSMSTKDGTAAKKLIKKAAKEFRNSQLIRITLDKNGATEELAGDYEYLKQLCGGIADVEVELLPDAERGTVIVDNGSEITDAGIQTQLRMIQEIGGGKFRGKKTKPSSQEDK